jgi:hypothetical protein
MKVDSRKLRFLLGLISAVLFLALIFTQLSVNSIGKTAVAAESNDSNLFLPLVLRNYPPAPPIFGAQIDYWPSLEVINLADESDLYWMRINAFDWDSIEALRTSPPTYDWDQVNESTLKTAAARGLQVIATVRFAPEWARQLPDYSCGPITEGAFQAYGEFLNTLVKRYSQPPFNIKYWEIGNEPDAPPISGIGSKQVFGCWGDPSDAYFGGGYYAEMLKSAYPAIKSADPHAQVLVGGLLLDCDPTHPAPLGKSSCDISKFLEGILRNGGGNYFDIVSYHGYPYYTSPSTGLGSLYADEHFPGWEDRGGVVLGKADYLREVLANFGFVKPVMHTEGSLICPEADPNCNPPAEDFFESQADYAVWLYVRNWAAGIRATIWYTFPGPGWRYGGVLDENQQPKPAYYALDFLTQELAEASYVREITQFSSLKTFEFSAPGKKIWIMWAPDEISHTIALPSGANKVYDKYGNDVTPPDSQIAVSSPVYVELAP